jgi:hypothetical protein
MRDKTGGGEAVWQEEELSAAALSDSGMGYGRLSCARSGAIESIWSAGSSTRGVSRTGRRACVLWTARK